MEKVGFFKTLEKNRVWKLVVFFVLEVMILGCYFVAGKWAEDKGKRNTIDNLTAVRDFDCLFKIEEINAVNNEIDFEGWIFYPNMNNKEVYLVLSEVDKEEEKIFECEIIEREDVVNQYMSSSNNQDIGFTVSVKEKELLKDKCYEVYIALTCGRENEKKIKTQQFFYNGELYNYNPKEFKAPEIFDEELLSVIEKGTVRAYSDEYGVWVYQVEQSLYYFVESAKKSFSANTDILIPVMPRTSRIELLPETRQQYKSDHLGAYHSDEVYWRDGVIPYEVIKIELPTEYPITYLETGLYDETHKKWVQKFMIPMFQ